MSANRREEMSNFQKIAKVVRALEIHNRSDRERQLFALQPLDDDQITLVVLWAMDFMGKGVQSLADVAFEAITNGAGLTGEHIVNVLQKILKRGIIPRRAVTDYLMQKFEATEHQERFDEYCRFIAADLIEQMNPKARDRARHLSMAVARTDEDWEALAQEFADEADDLRENVIDRFFRLCGNKEARIILEQALEGREPAAETESVEADQASA